MNKKFLYLGLAVIVIIGLALFFRPKAATSPTKTASSSATVEPKRFELVVKNKKLVAGSENLKVTEGDQVEITITNDEDEEFHLHGYDKAVELKKDQPEIVKFTANITGSFPFELENSKTDLGSLEVDPK